MVSVVRNTFIFLHVFTVDNLIVMDYSFTPLLVSGRLCGKSFSSYSEAFVTSPLSMLVT